jgi:hypothetical protein
MDGLMTDQTNGGAPPISVPVGDANLIKTLQHFLTMAERGQICGCAIVALETMGGVQIAPVVPPNPGAFYVLMGALTSLSMLLNMKVQEFAQQRQPSSILRPNLGMR